MKQDGFESESPQASLCPQCGRRLGQKGTFTYWIFQEDRCHCAASAASSKAIATSASGRQILNERYELIECVGRGGMGFVYKGRDLATNQLVALKIMRPELAENPKAVKE